MRKASTLHFLWVLCACALVTASAEARSRFTWEEHRIIDEKWPDAIETSTGLRYRVEREGSGRRPQAGDRVSVLYTGRLLDGTKFDEATDPEHPLVFRLARGEVIRGWEEAIAMMEPGKVMTLIVPAELAYGTRGRPPNIPRSAALHFEVELLKIEPVE